MYKIGSGLSRMRALPMALMSLAIAAAMNKTPEENMKKRIVLTAISSVSAS
jgi:hypothetical protein